MRFRLAPPTTAFLLVGVMLLLIAASVALLTLTHQLTLSRFAGPPLLTGP